MEDNENKKDSFQDIINESLSREEKHKAGEYEDKDKTVWGKAKSGAKELAYKGVSETFGQVKKGFFGEEFANAEKSIFKVQAAQTNLNDIIGAGEERFKTAYKGLGKSAVELGQDIGDSSREFESLFRENQRLVEGFDQTSDSFKSQMGIVERTEKSWDTYVDTVKLARMTGMETSDVFSTMSSSLQYQGKAAGDTASTLALLKRNVADTGYDVKQATDFYKKFTQELQHSTFDGNQLADSIGKVTQAQERLSTESKYAFKSPQQAMETYGRALSSVNKAQDNFSDALFYAGLQGGNLEDALGFMFDKTAPEAMTQMAQGIADMFGGEILTYEEASAQGRTQEYMAQSQLFEKTFGTQGVRETEKLMQMLKVGDIEGARGLTEKAETTKAEMTGDYGKFFPRLYTIGEKTNQHLGEIKTQLQTIGRYGLVTSGNIVERISGLADKFTGGRGIAKGLEHVVGWSADLADFTKLRDQAEKTGDTEKVKQYETEIKKIEQKTITEKEKIFKPLEQQVEQAKQQKDTLEKSMVATPEAKKKAADEYKDLNARLSEIKNVFEKPNLEEVPTTSTALTPPKAQSHALNIPEGAVSQAAFEIQTAYLNISQAISGTESKATSPLASTPTQALDRLAPTETKSPLTPTPTQAPTTDKLATPKETKPSLAPTQAPTTDKLAPVKPKTRIFEPVSTEQQTTMLEFGKEKKPSTKLSAFRRDDISIGEPSASRIPMISRDVIKKHLQTQQQQQTSQTQQDRQIQNQAMQNQDQRKQEQEQKTTTPAETPIPARTTEQPVIKIEKIVAQFGNETIEGSVIKIGDVRYKRRAAVDIQDA